VPASSSEAASPSVLLPTIEKISPEFQQSQALIDAGAASVKGQVWAFLTGASLSAQPGSMGPPAKNASFKSMYVGANVDIGFDTFPTIQFARDSEDQLKANKTQLNLEMQFLTENAIESLIEVEKQFTDSQASEDFAKSSYEQKYLSYGLGGTDLTTVLSTVTTVVNATTSRIQAQLDLDNMRINLHRLLLTDQFSHDKIQGCQVNADAFKKLKSGGFFAWIKDTLNPSANRTTIDDACRPAKPQS
jgi:outer membrane protein TolC